MIGLGNLRGAEYLSRAHGVSANGSVVVGQSQSAFGSEAFRWTSGEGMIGLGDLPGGGFRSWARDVSANGSVVVGSGLTALGQEAFIWVPLNSMRNLRDILESGHGLDLTGWALSAAEGISADGKTIVGWGVNPNGLFEAWIAHIPEPAALTLLAGASLLAFARRRFAFRTVRP